jgi:hypothetical protein
MTMSLSLMSLLPGVDRGLKSMKAECEFRGCHNKQLFRNFPGTRPGICVGQLWYCSVDCFALALRTPFSNLSTRRSAEVPRNPRLSLGLVMLSKGYLKPEQHRMAIAQSQLRGEELAATVLRLGLATEKQVAAALSAQWGYPMLAQDYIGKTVQADLPRAILHACQAAPLHYSESAKRILLGFVSRVEHSVLESIEQMTDLRVEPCFITRTDFEEQMGRLTSFAKYEEMAVNDPGPAEKMARTVGRAAVEVGARGARFAQYRNHVWARIFGKRGTVDVVFRMNQGAADAKPVDSEVFFEPRIAHAG